MSSSTTQPIDDAPEKTQENSPSPLPCQCGQKGLPSCTCAEWFTSPTRAPLFYWPVADVPVDEKLHHVRAALAAGHDPNEVDHATDPKRQRGRPLNMCLDESQALGNGSRLYENAPVIALLLAHGADPRLHGVPTRPHVPGYPGPPLREAQATCEEMHRQPDAYEGSVVQFWERAYALMREAADRMDDGLAGDDAGRGQPTATATSRCSIQ